MDEYRVFRRALKDGTAAYDIIVYQVRTKILLQHDGGNVINAIDIAEEHRGRGVGRRLVDEILDKCHDEGIDTVRAIFPEKNEKLRKAVENLGFRRSPVVNYDMTSDV